MGGRVIAASECAREGAVREKGTAFTFTKSPKATNMRWRGNPNPAQGHGGFVDATEDYESNDA